MNCLTKLEKVQKRSLRCIYNNSTGSYKDLIHKCDKSTLYVNRQRVILQYMYKILNDDVPPYLTDSISLDTNRHTTRCLMKVKQPAFRTITHGRYSMSYYGPKLWNILPNNLKMCKSYKAFKMSLRGWKGNACACNSCVQCKLENV